MYNNPYYVPLANGLDMQELQRQKGQLQQLSNQLSGQPNINQTFQIGTNNYEVIRYANNIDEVIKSYVLGDTPFFSRDMSIVWLKNNKGEIRTFELNEVIQKDDKDIQIELLQAQINELKKEIKNDADSKYIDESIEDKKPSSIQTSSRTKKD